VVVALWLVDPLAGINIGAYRVSPLAGVAALIIGLGAFVAILTHKRSAFDLTSAMTINGFQLVLIALIASSGNASSPYLPLWITGGLLAYIVGLRTFVPSIIFGAVYLTVLALGEDSIGEKVTFAMVILLPLVFSMLIWRQPKSGGQKQHGTMNELSRKLNENSVQSDLIINSIADGVLVLNDQGIIQVINPAAANILGWKEDALNLDYRSVIKIVNRNDVPVDAQFEPIQQCLRTNETVVNDTLRIQTPAGKSMYASILASPIGKFGQGAIVVFRDTSAQHAEERQQIEFISTASHEMRTPVAAIEGYLGLALNPSTANIDDKARMYLQKAHESAQHLGQLFQDLLDVSKAEDGRIQSKPVVIELATYIGKVLEDFSGQFEEKGLKLVYKQSKEQLATSGTIAPLYYVRADAGHLREVFSNLISNAIKYTKEGDVTVDISSENNRVSIKVSDSGIGIPAEDISHLFQKFYRVDNTDTREIGGTGLGLYLSRRLIESMDGHLDVESTYGKGSTFIIDLPRMTQDDIKQSLEQLSSAAQTPTTPQA